MNIQIRLRSKRKNGIFLLFFLWIFDGKYVHLQAKSEMAVISMSRPHKNVKNKKRKNNTDKEK